MLAMSDRHAQLFGRDTDEVERNALRRVSCVLSGIVIHGELRITVNSVQ